jgi:multisubunit Na+/H+ antiporter MnhG subunit
MKQINSENEKKDLMKYYDWAVIIGLPLGTLLLLLAISYPDYFKDNLNAKAFFATIIILYSPMLLRLIAKEKYREQIKATEE